MEIQNLTTRACDGAPGLCRVVSRDGHPPPPCRTDTDDLTGYADVGGRATAPASVLLRGLPIVTRLRERLPVRSIPEEDHVAAVWRDMVDDTSCRGSLMTAVEWTLAQRMISEEPGASAVPFSCVAAGVSGSAVVIAERLVSGLEVRVRCAVATLDERRTARIGARLLRTSRHAGRMQGRQKSAFVVGMDSHIEGARLRTRIVVSSAQLRPLVQSIS